MLKLGFASLIAFVSLLSITGPGCSDVKNAYNCDQICDRYKDCFDDNYDNTECQNDCEASADDDGYAEKAEDCESCLDSKSCTESFSCADECIGIVP